MNTGMSEAGQTLKAEVSFEVRMRRSRQKPSEYSSVIGVK